MIPFLRQFVRPLLVILSFISVVSVFFSLADRSYYKNSHPIPSRSLPLSIRGENRIQDVVSEEINEEWSLEKANIPELIMADYRGRPKFYAPYCARFPTLYDVRFNNIYWQIQETGVETYYLYSAYLDLRASINENGSLKTRGKSASSEFIPVVRVLGMSDGTFLTKANSTLTVCQFWFENTGKPVFTKVTEVRLLWYQDWGRGHYYPYLITCPLPRTSSKVPVSVSVVTDACANATNNLDIVHKERMKLGRRIAPPLKNFAVCVKALEFPHGSKILPRLTEWIELNRLLGADKIFFYQYSVGSSIKKLLDYYENHDIIGVTPTTLPGQLPNHPQLRHIYINMQRKDKQLTELIPYNDCLYRNMYDYKYIAVVDTDEIIAPQKDTTWLDLLQRVNYIIDRDKGNTSIEPIATYCFKNFYFLDDMTGINHASEVTDIPNEFHMLKHVYRSVNSTDFRFLKCFHSTAETVGVHNHLPFFCREKTCNRHYVDTDIGIMNHYRSSCASGIRNCSKYLLDTVRDTTIWRYKDQLINRVQFAIKEIKR